MQQHTVEEVVLQAGSETGLDLSESQSGKLEVSTIQRKIRETGPRICTLSNHEIMFAFDKQDFINTIRQNPVFAFSCRIFLLKFGTIVKTFDFSSNLLWNSYKSNI